jgi:hypothetical protein
MASVFAQRACISLHLMHLTQMVDLSRHSRTSTPSVVGPSLWPRKAHNAHENRGPLCAFCASLRLILLPAQMLSDEPESVSPRRVPPSNAYKAYTHRVQLRIPDYGPCVIPVQQRRVVAFGDTETSSGIPSSSHNFSRRTHRTPFQCGAQRRLTDNVMIA